MKTILALTLIATIGAVSSGVALADNQRLENKLIRQRQKAAEKAAELASEKEAAVTIALSGTKNGSGNTNNLQPEFLYSGHGQTNVVYVPKD